MADWYISSVAWAAISQFAASTAYTVGNIIRPLTAPAAGHEHVFRCTTAGTSGTEPTWTSASSNGQTVASGGATFTNVTGQSTYGWSAAGGSLWCITYNVGAGMNRPLAGDRVFVSSDHTETMSGAAYGFNNGSAAFGLIQIISVNRGGSVPPAAGDALAGAALNAAAGNNITLEAYTNCLWQGITVNLGTATSSTGNLLFNQQGMKAHYLKNCAIVLNNTSSSSYIGNNWYCKIILDNTTIRFGNAGQGIYANYQLDLIWINTTSALLGTVPTDLFLAPSNNTTLWFVARGVDLSALTTNLATTGAYTGLRTLLDSCRIASGLTRYTLANNVVTDVQELVNCFDGTNVINESHNPAGDITTDRSTYLTGGAQDDIGNYSLKLVSSSRSDFQTMPLDCFTFDVENTLVGASHTAIVQIISSSTLNNTDIRLLLEYMGTSGSSIASMVESLASVLTPTAALSSSSATWNSPPATPQAQQLQVIFTPQRAGRIRATVRLGKVSATVWVDPRITVS